MTEFVTPPPAEPGDRVAVVAPSSGAAADVPDVLDLAVERLRDLGVEPVVYPTARQSDGYLRDHPEARAADVHAAVRDPDISAVFATIGGDDQVRVLDRVDPAVLREHPTRFFGMSDNANLATLLWTAGVVSYYGGQLLNQVATPGRFHEYSREYLERALFEETVGDLRPAEEWTDDVVSWYRDDYAEVRPEYEDDTGWRWHGDRAVDGRVWGGCLAILRWQLLVDRYLPDPERLDGQVLAIETAEDMPAARRVRWTLRGMGERGLLERFDAVLVGRPQTRNREEDPGREARSEYRENQREAILAELERYNPDATVVFDLDFGHTNPTVPLPIGGRVSIDPDAETIRFE
ncbi:S66 family peptidase [Halomicrobium salinisoli]|uniref:S66 family peptidase n=1 Tax=Halomicrobium salinisoli TaxID=2878391 RepID=UPI001CF05408|nr:S66 peptidase family protein [Halomicrobium salinisoli]